MCNCDDPNHNHSKISRRAALRGGLAVTAAAATTIAGATAATAQAANPYADPENSVLPPSNMKLDLSRAALVVTDPQVDFLSPEGVTWGVVGASVTEHLSLIHISEPTRPY